MNTKLTIGLILLSCQLLPAQTRALTPAPQFQPLSNSGAILPGAKLCTYSAGTTTPATTYSDAAGTTNTNPITLNSAGRATIFVSSSAYKFILYNQGTGNTCNGFPVGALIWSVDNIRDYGLVAIEAGTLSGTGAANKCARWTGTTTLGASSVDCGTISGSGTAGVLSKFTSGTAIGNSNVTEDSVLKINEQTLVNGTASDVSTGGLVVIDTITEASAAVNAQTIKVYATGGGGGRGIIESSATGTAMAKGMAIWIDGMEWLFIDTDGSITIPELACPTGMTAPITVDDTGKLIRGSCS